MIVADLTIKEVNTPINNWCDSGHYAPEVFRRSGPDSPEQPIRFFKVIGNNINKVCCEPCLIVANWIAKQNKK